MTSVGGKPSDAGAGASETASTPSARPQWTRQVHRWLSIAFTVTVIANLVAFGLGKPLMWLVYSPLPPLFLLMFTGLYMFVLPYATEWRSRRSAEK